MSYYKKIIPLLLAALIFSGCEEKEPEIAETTAAETTADNRYLLVRGWDGTELLSSIFYCGQYRSLPFSLEEYPDFTFSGENLVFPDGSYAEASQDEDGAVTALKFKRGTAPADLSVYGIDFGAKPEDIQPAAGIANSVYGSEETSLTYSYFEGGITELTFVFTEGVLTEVYIAS